MSVLSIATLVIISVIILIGWNFLLLKMFFRSQFFEQIEYCGSSSSTVVLLNFRAGGWRLHCKSFFVSYPLLLALASSSTTPFQKLFYCLMKRGKFCWHWQLRKILHFFFFFFFYSSAW